MKPHKYKFTGEFSFEVHLEEGESLEIPVKKTIRALKEEVLCLLGHDVYVSLMDADGEFSVNLGKVKAKLKQV